MFSLFQNHFLLQQYVFILGNNLGRFLVHIPCSLDKRDHPYCNYDSQWRKKEET